jgi:signal transduction histidine kinase
VFWIDRAAAERPRLVRGYSRKNGLADDAITSIVEDRRGRLYIGTRRGLDRVDPASGRIRHFTVADGLAAQETHLAYRDRHGVLWWSTSRGLSSHVPGDDPAEAAPSALVDTVRIDGDAQPLSDLGETIVGPLKLPSARSRIEIGFFALSFMPGEAPKYQYALEGIDAWSPPTEQQLVTYPRLAPGNYRFLVRAVQRDGTPGRSPASVTFAIPPPIWARWWFLAIVAATVMLAAHAAHRIRTARLLEIERIRTRLAMDLHDDIGSTLSQVAVLSEVARQRAGGDRQVAEPLARIAEISRQLVDAMSDVVWAINPERDSLRELAQRMRGFAAETLDARNIQLRFDAPSGDGDIRLGADVRREMFLIFKEGVHNLLRYAQCTRADISLSLQDGTLVLSIADDGVGLDATVRGGGLGLRSMQERAKRIGADLSVRLAPGEGASVRLVVPLGRPRRRGKS